MKSKLPEIVIKVVLIGLEVLFVGILCALRLQIIGWMLVILGLAFIAWVLLHLGLMTAFIIGMKVRAADVVLYLATHFFYLIAWLFQTDSGDGGGYNWTIQQIYSSSGLTVFLKQWADTVFWCAFAGTFICYALMIVLLAVKLIKYAQSMKPVEGVGVSGVR